MSDEFDDGIIVHAGNEVSFSTTIKELLECVILYRDNFSEELQESQDFKGLCKLLSNEIEIQSKYQEETIREYNKVHGGVKEVKDNVTPLKPKE